ncbi:response regulator [Phreatobacter aquaticus]|uniref:Response regulator n=1 Tax=Phreatobacter aquaticus TaxID=2570229 RepID=A0A4D7QMG5_9HYPH|nr:response regulator [Phreatobacter aquaticus]QCK86287.1 response regulator [Phreatobacter aquaticus]
MVAHPLAFQRRLIRSALSGLGRFHESRTGFDVIEAAERLRPDLIVMNRKLHGLDALESTKLLRSSASELRFVSIIMLSGDTTQAMLKAALAAGVNDIVAKPFSLAIMRRRSEILLQEPLPFLRTRTFFGPVPRSERIAADVIQKASALRTTSLTCAIRMQPVDQERCPLTRNCVCRRYVKGQAPPPVHTGSGFEVVEL